MSHQTTISSYFIEFCVYGLHWIVSKPISYSRIIIVNSYLFFFALYSNLQSKIKIITYSFYSRKLHSSWIIFCFLFSVLFQHVKNHLCFKIKFEVKTFCINDFSNFQSTFITSFPLHTICGGFIFYSLSTQFKGQSEYILTNWGKQSCIIQNTENFF